MHFSSQGIDEKGRPVYDALSYLYPAMRSKEVTLQSLCLVYNRQTPDVHHYRCFHKSCRADLKKIDPLFRHDHRAGKKTFLDIAGQTAEGISKEAIRQEQ